MSRKNSNTPTPSVNDGESHNSDTPTPLVHDGESHNCSSQSFPSKVDTLSSEQKLEDSGLPEQQKPEDSGPSEREESNKELVHLDGGSNRSDAYQQSFCDGNTVHPNQTTNDNQKASENSEPKPPIDEMDINLDPISRLNKLVGLKSVKKKFHDLQKRILLRKKQGTDLSKERFNAIFQGNPGTGTEPLINGWCTYPSRQCMLTKFRQNHSG